MRVFAIATLALTGCVSVSPYGPNVYHCAASTDTPAGLFGVVAALAPGRPPLHFDMSLGVRDRASGANIGLGGWSGRQLGPPPDNTPATVRFRLIDESVALPRHLELRSGGQVIRRGSTTRGSFFWVNTSWGMLSAAAARGPISAAVVDQQGRTIAEEAIPSGFLAVPEAAIAARSRWNGVVGAASRQCPPGTEESVEIIVT